VYKTGEAFFAEEMKATHFPGSANNGEVYIDLSVQAYRNDKDEIEGLLFFSYEVTGQVMSRREVELNAARLEDIVRERTSRLTEANTALEQSNRNLQAFASIASHDLQEPLRKIKTFTGMLLKRYASDFSAEASTLLQKTETAAIRMSNLIRDVLNYSRITVPENSYALTDLNGIFQNVLEDFELLISEKNATVNLHSRLPLVEAVPSQINQLFYNLMGNALKFASFDREPVIDINCEVLNELEKNSLNVETSVEFYRITIADNGIGFEQQYAGQIFAIFERLNNVNQYEGTGIGLALCLKIVQYHKGFIFAEGQQNVGSKFTLILPASQPGTNVV
jgi:two-component system CheB/CheR fusion protein